MANLKDLIVQGTSRFVGKIYGLITKAEGDQNGDNIVSTYLKKTDAASTYQAKGSYAAASHTHDDRYYTETEMNTKLEGKSDTGHTHSYLPLSGGQMTGTISGTTAGDWAYWTAGTNISCSASSNNQEWSIDLKPTASLTGTYWQVWTDKGSKGSLLKVAVDTGAVSAPYGFVGNITGTVSGNAATATKATQDGDGNVIKSTYSKTGHTHTSANISDILKATAVTNLGWDNAADHQKALAMSRIAYWNGAYGSANVSNLAYCNKGAFGDMATESKSSYSSATQVNSALGGKLSIGGGTLTGSTKNSSTAASSSGNITSSSTEVVNGKAIYNYIENKLAYDITITI